MKKLLALPGIAAVASFASATPTAPTWWPSEVTSTVFDGVIYKAAPIAILTVVGVAGVRVVIKLLNRAAGK